MGLIRGIINAVIINTSPDLKEYREVRREARKGMSEALLAPLKVMKDVAKAPVDMVVETLKHPLIADEDDEAVNDKDPEIAKVQSQESAAVSKAAADVAEEIQRTTAKMQEQIEKAQPQVTAASEAVIKAAADAAQKMQQTAEKMQEHLAKSLGQSKTR